MEGNDLIATDEAAKILNVSAETLRRYTDEGKLPSQRTSGGHRRWSKAAVLAYAYQQRNNLNPEDTITVVESYPAVWDGLLIIKTDGSKIWHTIECKRKPFEAGTGPLATAIARGETWKHPMELEVYYDDERSGCVAQRWFGSTGTRKEDVEADLAVALTELTEELGSLTAKHGVVSFVTPEGQVLSAEPDAY